MLNVLFYFFTFVAGTFLGSFLNLVSDRIKTKESVLFGRSHCDGCYKPLGWRNLIPLFSFLFQRGKCPFCKTKLSLFYPLSETLTGLLFALAAYVSGGNPLGFLFLAVTFGFYIVLFITDLKYMLLPDKVIYPAIGFVVLMTFFTQFVSLFALHKQLSSDTFGVYLIKAGYWNNQLIYSLKDLGATILSALIIAFFFWFLVFITKGRGMGGGDVKLSFLIGILNGFPFNIIAIFLGFFIGALYSVFMMLIKRKGLKDAIPFGPFLILGSIITIVYGTNLLNWYLGLF